MTKLNLGCGNDIIPGWVNVDFIKKKGIDKVHNLNKYPYPFKDNTFDEIKCVEVVEHLDDTVATMKEIFRILKPGGKVIITVPYFLSVGAWSNPEHKRAFNYQTFKYFISGTDENSIHNIGINFSAGRIRLTYGKGFYPVNYVMGPLINAFPDFFERTFLKSFFHPDGIMVELTK